MEPTAEPEVSAPTPRPTLRERLGEKLPEIFIQALFLLIAVVLAFAVEEWREERELDRLAGEARLAILQEIERNHDELLESRTDTTAAIATLATALAAAAQGTPLPDEVMKGFELSLFSSAAWNTAQSTEASRRMDYAWMLQVSQTYELQAMVQQAQDGAVQSLVALRAAGDEGEKAAAARQLLGHLRLYAGLGKALEEDYLRFR